MPPRGNNHFQELLNENQCVVHRVSWYCVRVFFRSVGCVSSIGAKCIVGEIKNNPSTHESNIVCEPSVWELTKTDVRFDRRWMCN